jgi:hypothetical protein
MGEFLVDPIWMIITVLLAAMISISLGMIFRFPLPKKANKPKSVYDIYLFGEMKELAK